MKTRLIKALLLASICFVQLGLRAEDIDLFAGSPASSSATAPNVLLIIDNAANFSSSASPSSAGTCTISGATNSLSGTVGGIEQCALYTVLNSLAVTANAAVNIGVMAYNGSNVVTYTGAACASSGDGGCLLYPLTGLTTSTKPQLLAWIAGWKTSNGGAGSSWIKASGQATGATMQEAWSYYAGRVGLSGTNYSSFKPAIGCNKNFVIFIGNSYSSSGSPGDATGDKGPKNALEGSNANALMNASPVATSGQKTVIGTTSANAINSCGTASISTGTTHENGGFYADEWARYMLAQSSITTYTIGVLGNSCKPEYSWLLNSMATVGGGKYFPTTDYSGLKTAFETILSEVQSVNSVFASVSLPVSVNTQGTYLNQVFVGMFRPDGDSLPRWAGNLKQYKLGYLNGTLQLLDADGAAAISSSGSDFVAECARSFWTPGSTLTGDGYWTSLATSNCVGYPATANSPDGNIVEKGGQGYMLRSMTPTSRVVKTCSSSFASCTTLTNFDTANAALTQTLLDSTSAVSSTTLVNWARGQNTQGEAGGSPTLTLTAMRPSTHGDVVHSRPVAVNFGTDATPKVMVFYGGNDGVLRAINGNRSTAFTVGSTSVAAGAELWAFMPPEFYSSIKRLYDNSTKISTPYITGIAKNYGMDGAVTAYKDTAVSNSDAWIYAGMRRGGRAMYAFTVNGSTLAITLRWKRGCDSLTTTCTNDLTNGNFSNIGQTWATPKVFKAAGYGSGASPLLAMGGGYDANCEDATSYTCTNTTGNNIYVMDASSGVLLKTFTTDRGVVGDVTILQDSGGLATFGYAADLGGNVYRISGINANVAIGSTPPALWTLTKIAALGCNTGATCTSPPNRKFMFGPDVVVEGGTNILLLGSGDREKPLNTSNATSNYFFKIEDKPTTTNYLSSVIDNCSGMGVICLSSLLPITAGTTPSAASLAGKKGWYLALNSNEQVVTSAIAVFGTVYFSTNQPTPAVSNSCSSNLGLARAYGVSYVDAGNRVAGAANTSPYTLLTSGGLAPSPVAGKVTLDDGSTVPFIIGARGPLQASFPTQSSGLTSSAKVRSYWYIQK